MFYSPFSELQRQESGSIAVAGTISLTVLFSYTLLAIAVDILKWKDMSKSPWRQEKLSLLEISEKNRKNFLWTSLRGVDRTYRPSPGSATELALPPL